MVLWAMVSAARPDVAVWEKIRPASDAEEIAMQCRIDTRPSAMVVTQASKELS